MVNHPAPWRNVRAILPYNTATAPVFPLNPWARYNLEQYVPYHKHTHFRCTLHATTVRNFFTNIPTSGVPYTPVQYEPYHKYTHFRCSLHASTVHTLFTNLLTSGASYSTYLVHKHTRFPCTLHASTVPTLFTNILTSGVPYTPVQYIPCSQTYSLPVFPSRQYSTYLVHKPTHFRCILQYVPCSQTHSLPVYPTRQYSAYLVHKHTRFPCTLHASTVRTLFTNILTSGVPYSQYSTYLVHKHTCFPCTTHASTVRTLFTNILASRVPYTPVQYIPCSQTYSLLVFPTRQYSTYLVHKHTHFRCTLHASTVHTLFTNILASRVPYTPVQCVPCSQTHSLPVYPTRQYSAYLVHKHTHFWCSLHASTVRTLFTNILTSGVPYTPVQYIPCSQTYSLPVYPTRQYSAYLVHKHTHFWCSLHASTVHTLFTNILASRVPYTPVQYIPCSQTFSLPVFPTRQYSAYLVHKHTHFWCTLHASTVRTLFANIFTSRVPYTPVTIRTFFTNILTSGVSYTPVQYVPCSQTYSLALYPPRQYSTYLVHKHTLFRCILHASTVHTLFTNILTSGVSYTPVQYVPCAQT